MVVIDAAGQLTETLHMLREQAAADRLEIVVVTPDRARTEQRYPELTGFETVRMCELRSWSTTSEALARGVRAARGAVVAYCEDHVLPEPGWAAARLEAHARGAAAVGGVLRNANPGTTASWASFLQSFGPFAVPVAGGPSASLPWHQCSYRRDVLPPGPELEAVLENEGLLHADLRAAGHTLVLESGSVAGHLNPSRLRSWLGQAWLGGRVWGAGRAAHGGWSVRRRAVHAASFALIACVEFRGRQADARRVMSRPSRPVVLLLAFGILVHAAAEAVGVLFGDSGASSKRADIELNRRAHLAPGDLTRP